MSKKTHSGVLYLGQTLHGSEFKILDAKFRSTIKLVFNDTKCRTESHQRKHAYNLGEIPPVVSVEYAPFFNEEFLVVLTAVALGNLR